MGGEKLRLYSLGRCPVGSPPRGRGKEQSAHRAGAPAGITPAWAGKSPLHVFPNGLSGDHPRVGGEKPGPAGPLPCPGGSPPRGRGKDSRYLRSAATSGITPAWAGKSISQTSTMKTARDHPRVGGEKHCPHGINMTFGGSPPRGRGKGIVSTLRIAYTGITPAWAGKRLKRSHRSGIFISGPIPFHSVLHRPAGSGGSRAGRDGAPAGQPQNAGPA